MTESVGNNESENNDLSKSVSKDVLEAIQPMIFKKADEILEKLMEEINTHKIGHGIFNILEGAALLFSLCHIKNMTCLAKELQRLETDVASHLPTEWDDIFTEFSKSFS